MKIAIAAMKNNEDSKVSEVFGRAPVFIIYENGKIVKSIKNPFLFGGGGAGLGVSQMLADEKVDIIIAGKIGQKAAGQLKANNIKVKELHDKLVKEVKDVS